MKCIFYQRDECPPKMAKVNQEWIKRTSTSLVITHLYGLIIRNSISLRRPFFFSCHVFRFAITMYQRVNHYIYFSSKSTHKHLISDGHSLQRRRNCPFFNGWWQKVAIDEMMMRYRCVFYCKTLSRRSVYTDYSLHQSRTDINNDITSFLLGGGGHLVN